MARKIMLVTLLLSIFVAGTLFAAGSEEVDSQESVTLTFWKHNHGPADEMTERLIAQFEEENPNVTIEMESIPHGQYITRLLTAIASGEAPDIFDLGDTDVPGFMANGVMAPIDYEAIGFSGKEEFAEEWLPTTLDPFSDAEGRLYGFPIEFNSWELFVNTAHFEEAGLSLPEDQPETWAELADVAERLTVRDGDGNITRSGFRLPFHDHAGWYLFNFEPHLLQRGGYILNEDMSESGLDSTHAAAVAEYWHDLVTEYNVTSAESTSAATAAYEDFGQEDASMWIAGPWAVAALSTYPVADNLTVVPLPQHDPDNPIHITSSWAWFVSESSSNKEVAWQFIDFASKFQEEWLTDVGYILPRKGWFETDAAKSLEGIDVFLNGMSYGRPRVRTLNYAEVAAAVQRSLQRVIMEGADPAGAMETAHNEVEQIIE